MNTLTTTNVASSTYFTRRESTGALQTALFVAAAALTVVVWLSAFGAGTQPRGYFADLVAQAPVRIQLPRVEIVGHRSELALVDATAVACAADRSHKPG